ncbi:hypothetical protein EGK75_07425 [Neisseria weixii]|uniref:Uncharacterized protein n=1 Tax=Neisseria weixii TaxID=1853276 RepID=A0A3N4MXI3_9NEIS|nr:hypothetical protein [Neisseria weixii]RPD86206.1 hypothetical protein EGK74_08140 [Neisseria weixii]RPD87189.1 hypothetical protein EGK75_07425 [Neisseria weixii]
MLQAKLIKYGLPALAAVLLLCAVWVGGFQTAFKRQQVVIGQIKAEAAESRLQAEQIYSAELEKALTEQKKWQDFAQSESAKLAQANRELDRRAAALEKEIKNVIEKDKSANGGRCIDGLGADGLRLYRQALGYAD